jgi:hypothetical protein
VISANEHKLNEFDSVDMVGSEPSVDDRIPLVPAQGLTMDVAYSVNGVPIRLTKERWFHIVNARDEMAGYNDDCLRCIEAPDLVLAGYRGSLKAIKGYGRNRYLVVIYRELSADDGFVITAYFVRRINRRNIVWRR